MNGKAQTLSVSPTDPRSAEKAFIQATLTATALSADNPEASNAFSRLLWALGSSPSLDDVGQLAERWIETIEETGPVGSVDPKELVEVLLIGAEAYMGPMAQHPVCRH
ncbi:hypothetical protein [Microvirga tunisiensis]|uniref:Uncharacterized protein n=1 Tax=Microvirga tunisiensis TaxID=2108360 RepID=A0A5N7MJN0_9HYPH|nr:hypothetical protein [Microvirga tunisiensis]MPR08845.1 hypothetical protein [Microvirga tunisiensis]MPR27028.1 hypothetical protein [Microvirga tunisiensis]